MHKLYAKSARESVDEVVGSIAMRVMGLLSDNGLVIYKSEGTELYKRESTEQRTEAQAGLVSVFRPHLQMVRAVYDQVARDLAETTGENDDPSDHLMGVLWRAYLRRIHPHSDFSVSDTETVRLKSGYTRSLTQILTERAVRAILADVEDLPTESSTQSGIVGLFSRRVLAMSALSSTSVIAVRSAEARYFDPEQLRREKVLKTVSAGAQTKGLKSPGTGGGEAIPSGQIEAKRRELETKFKAIMRGRSPSGHAFYITNNRSLFIDESETYEDHMRFLANEERPPTFEFIKYITDEELRSKSVQAFTTEIASREEREAEASGATVDQLRRLRQARTDDERDAINREIDAYRAQQSRAAPSSSVSIAGIDEKTSSFVTKALLDEMLITSGRVRVNERIAFADKKNVTFVAQGRGLRSLSLPRKDVFLSVAFSSPSSFVILPPTVELREEISRIALAEIAGIFDDDGFPAADVLGPSEQPKK